MNFLFWSGEFLSENCRRILMANFDGEFFGLVFPGFQATQKIHAQNSRPELPAFLSNLIFSNPKFIHGDFLLTGETKKCSEIFPEMFEALCCGSEMNPQNSRQISHKLSLQIVFKNSPTSFCRSAGRTKTTTTPPPKKYRFIWHRSRGFVSLKSRGLYAMKVCESPLILQNTKGFFCYYGRGVVETVFNYNQNRYLY